MKKLIILPLLLLAGSCSLFTKTPATFEEYYVRNAKATVESTEQTLKSLGFFRSYEANGTLDALVSIPVLLSGSLVSEYTSQTDGKNASVSFDNMKVQYDGLAGSGLLSMDTLGLISEQGNLHVLYKNLTDIGFSTPEMREAFAKFDGTWLSWTQEDARAGITDATELQAVELLDNLSALDRDTIEKYLVDYVAWKSTEDLGMSGALHMYRVELDRDNILALMMAIKSDMTGVDFTYEEKTALTEQLALINLTGTMGFHPEDTTVTDITLSLSDDTAAPLGTIVYSTTATDTRIVITSTDTDIALTYTYSHADDRDDMTLIFTQAGIEMGKAVGYVTRTDDEFRELGLDVTAQGITVTLQHNQKADGNFDGRLLLPVGSISWNGTTEDKKLTALKVQGASPMGAMDLDLTSSGEMIRGPFVLRVGDEEVMRATVGLIAEANRFRLAIDIPQGEDSTDMIHGEIGMTMNYSALLSKIKAPSGTKPLQDLLTELEKIAPEQFIDEPQGLDMYDDDMYDSELMIDDSGMLDEMDNFEPIQ